MKSMTIEQMKFCLYITVLMCAVDLSITGVRKKESRIDLIYGLGNIQESKQKRYLVGKEDGK
ncbi:hypothetical protein SOP87_05835 [Bacillus cereus]|uniref:hypothetical protein n=1 Tax=Bacillus cereus TaxID=1396 RepID=UPI002B24A7DD|nr:hypothetical protein [Bacillus cereus]MEB2585249.1 hypothetical protein [Bacillus cereus]